MTQNTIISQFSKSGAWAHLRRKWCNLSTTAKKMAVELISGGVDPAMAIKRAKGAK